MNSRALLRISSLLALAACQTVSGPAKADNSRQSPLRIASFNIRYGTAEDGEDRWERRRDLVLETIRGLDADLLGLQEALEFQVQELAQAFPRYSVIGLGREADGRGEQTALMLDRERFRVVRSGTFWLSETPEVVASRAWDAALPRICTWAVLFDSRSQVELLWMNTHFDHRGAKARAESGALIHSRLAEFPGMPVVITGDLNADERSAPLAALRGDTLVDSFRIVHPEAIEVGTFNRFTGKSDGEKIDYVLCGFEWKVEDASIERRQFDGRFPSDHFPVTATLSLGQQ